MRNVAAREFASRGACGTKVEDEADMHDDRLFECKERARQSKKKHCVNRVAEVSPGCLYHALC